MLDYGDSADSDEFEDRGNANGDGAVGRFSPTGAFLASPSSFDDEPRRIGLREPLPCAMWRCGAPTSAAIAEPDPDFPGVWLLLPLCREHDGRAG